MKRFLTLILLLLSVPLFSQRSYHPIADNNKEWNILALGFGGYGISTPGSNIISYFDYFTFINGLVYYPVYETYTNGYNSLKGYVRESFSNQEVYFMTSNQQNEGLIYDFSLQVGDSVTIQNYHIGFNDPYKYYCANTDSILINNQYHKRIYLSEDLNTYHLADIWIEGVGSKYGLLYSGGDFYPGGSFRLLCCFDDDLQLYQDEGFDSCAVDEFLPKITTTAFDTAYLNTPYEFQLTHSDFDYPDEVEWYHFAFPEGLNLNAETGLISGIPTESGLQNIIVLIKNHHIGGYTTDVIDTLIYIDPITNINTVVDEAVKVYPNPSDGKFTVQKTSSAVAVLYIYNMYGQQVFTEKFSGLQSEITCKDLSSGVYVIEIREKNKTIFQQKITLN